MVPYPVSYSIEKPARYSRLQLLVRLIALVALGILGLSLGLLYLVAFLLLPAYAAARLSGRDAETYFREDAPGLVLGLAWFASIYAWFGLVTDQLPVRASEKQAHIAVEPMGTPTAASALWRLLLGFPSALVLAFLGWLGGLVWLWSVLRVVLFEHVGETAHAYLTGLQRWSVRLLAYQASLVDVYPPFSFEDAPSALPQAHSAP